MVWGRYVTYFWSVSRQFWCEGEGSGSSSRTGLFWERGPGVEFNFGLEPQLNSNRSIAFCRTQIAVISGEAHNPAEPSSPRVRLLKHLMAPCFSTMAPFCSTAATTQQAARSASFPQQAAALESGLLAAGCSLTSGLLAQGSARRDPKHPASPG